MTMQKFKTYQIAVKFYQNCQQLRLKEPLRSQFQRACLSIVLNLAEGSAKPTAKDRRKFYRISLGSLREIQAILMLVKHPELERQANMLGAYLYELCKNT